MKNILFRLNAGDKYGLGHYFRTLALAESLKEKGHRIRLVHNDNSFWNEQKKFPFEKIATLENPDQIDENQLFDLVENDKIDTVVVDGNITYSENLWKELSSRKIEIINYQNLSESRMYCDKYILPSIHQQEKFFKDFNTTKTKIYQGLEYFTFNKNILQQTKKKPTDSIDNIAITTGGSDPNNLTKLLFEIFSENQNFVFNFYLGDNYMFAEQSKQWKKQPHLNFKKYDIQDVLKNDLLISAFGVSTYEFLALGMPIIAIGHQKSNADAADFLANKTQAIYSLGEMQHLKATDVNQFISNLATDIEKVNQLVINSQKIIDLKGLDRVIKIVENE